MEGVIPNSKVVFKPPQIVDGEQQGSWKKELYLRPGEWIPWVTVAVVGTTIVLAIVVLLLHLGEKVMCFYMMHIQGLIWYSGRTRWNGGELRI